MYIPIHIYIYIHTRLRGPEPLGVAAGRRPLAGLQRQPNETINDSITTATTTTTTTTTPTANNNTNTTTTNNNG